MRKCKKLLLYGKKKNSKHEKYYNKDEKQKAWKRIATKLINRGFREIEDVQVSEKTRSLRSYYGTKKQKEKASKLLLSETHMSL